MRIVVVTALTPTPENRGGISALLYSLVYYRPNDVDIKILSYNFNHISGEEISDLSEQLRTEIDVLSIPQSYSRYKRSRWLTRYDKFVRRKPLETRLVSHQVLDQIKKEECSFVLLYPICLSVITELIPWKQFVVLAPDSGILIRSRRLNNAYRLRSRQMIFDDCFYLMKNKAMECSMKCDNTKVHFVGMADWQMYSDVTGNDNAHFLLHPYVKYKEKQIGFSRQKLRVIISGGYDMYYNTDLDKMLPLLIERKDELLKHFVFTFLGKHWSPIDERLKSAGFTCEFKTWVDDYAEELASNDIMIAPVSFGTGTKGKVLDAMVNGLLVIGSKYALENISIRDMDSCVRYHDASHIASILISIANHRERYQAIAEKGRSQVLKYHDPRRISKRFFEIYYREFNKS